MYYFISPLEKVKQEGIQTNAGTQGNLSILNIMINGGPMEKLTFEEGLTGEALAELASPE